MDDEDAGVAMSRWHCPQGSVDVARTTGLIAAFAGDHGMRREDRTAVSQVVSQVLACAAGDTRAELEAVVDAATDGEWLTVWVRGTVAEAGNPVRALAAATVTADRVDWVAERDAAITVVMEFAIGPGRLH
jgi:hypothetical protein